MASSTVKARFFCPYETARHVATTLGFPSKVCIPSADYERACVIAISQAITKYPSNTSNISVIPFLTNHLWIRDTGPVYVRGVGEPIHQRFAVNFRFSEWGRKLRLATTTGWA
ncbi:hypothetical protein N7527_010370 [Penicillium freii]|nr:hypothetical protein N7527_010370 [Penicillium freii]